jgi:hypothetical protein
MKRNDRAAERDFTKRFSEMIPGTEGTHAEVCISPRR